MRLMNQTVSFNLPERFNSLIDWLMNDVAGSVVWGWIPLPAIKLLWRRLRRLRCRFNSIVARFEAGTLPAAESAVRRVEPDPGAPDRPAAAPRALELPQRVGWVLQMISGALIPGYELEVMLESAGMAALVAEAPQLGGVLRPMCRMLAVKPPAWLRLPRRARPMVEKFPPAPEWLVAEPGAMLRPDGTVWMRFGASRSWNPRCGHTLEEALKFDRPIKIWPREE